MEQTFRQKIKHRILFSVFLSIFSIILLCTGDDLGAYEILQDQKLMGNSAVKLCILMLFLFLEMWAFWPLYRIPKDLILEPMEEFPLYKKIESDVEEINFLEKKMISLFYQNTKKETAAINIAKQVAHDIRSPILALETICSMSAELPIEKRDLIEKTIQRITAIVNNLFYITNPRENVRADKRANKKFIIDVVLDVIEEKKMECYERNIFFKLHYSESIIGFIADIADEKIERCLSNILNNSIEAMGNYGEIFLYLNLVDKQIKIKIVDNGKGIPKDKLDKIFIKGFSFNKNQGYGLGLSYAKECLEQAGGYIRVESEVNKGTTVDITIKSKLTGLE